MALAVNGHRKGEIGGGFSQFWGLLPMSPLLRALMRMRWIHIKRWELNMYWKMVHFVWASNKLEGSLLFSENKTSCSYCRIRHGNLWRMIPIRGKKFWNKSKAPVWLKKAFFYSTITHKFNQNLNRSPHEHSLNPLNSCKMSSKINHWLMQMEYWRPKTPSMIWLHLNNTRLGIYFFRSG